MLNVLCLFHAKSYEIYKKNVTCENSIRENFELILYFYIFQKVWLGFHKNPFNDHLPLLLE